MFHSHLASRHAFFVNHSQVSVRIYTEQEVHQMSLERHLLPSAVQAAEETALNASESDSAGGAAWRMLHVSLAHINALKNAREAAQEADAGTASFLAANRGAIYARLYPMLDVLAVRAEVSLGVVILASILTVNASSI